MSLLQVIFGTLSWLPMKSVHWRVPCTNRGCWGAVVTPLHGLCPGYLLRIADTPTRWRTLTRREPIHGGSAAPSLAQRVSLALPKSLWSVGTASLRDGVWTKSRPWAAGMLPSRLQGGIHDVSAFVRTPGQHLIDLSTHNWDIAFTLGTANKKPCQDLAGLGSHALNNGLYFSLRLSSGVSSQIRAS